MAYTPWERSVNARKQLRGKDGKWIFMGGGVKWFDALKGIMRAGTVDGFDGDYVHVVGTDGSSNNVHRKKITAIPKKATLTSEKATPSGPQDISSWKKGSALGGSNGAAIYTDPDGNQYAVKFLKSEDHAKNEVLASRLYSRAGVDIPLQELVTLNGKTGLASPMLPDTQGDLSSKLNDKAYLDKIRDGFAADAWLANWDVAGLNYDNILTDKDGDPVRIDPGGSLLYRAQGSPKGEAFGDVVGEWGTLRTSPQGKNVFGQMSDGQAKASAENLADITDADIDELVDSVGFDDAKANKLKSTLKARRDDIFKKAGITKPADLQDSELPQEQAPAFSILPSGERGLSGDGYHQSGPWGKYGASGLLLHAEDSDKLYIVQRGGNVSSNKGKWQLPGGALDEKETPYQAAARELTEETSYSEDQLSDITHIGDFTFDNGKGWKYTNIGANIPSEIDLKVDPKESADGKWVSEAELRQMRDNGELVPAFADNLDDILGVFDGDHKKTSADISDKEAKDFAEPSVQGIGGKSTGTGIPTSDNGQGVVTNDNTQTSLSGVAKGDITKNAQDIQSANIGQKVYDPSTDIEWTRTSVDNWEDSNGLKYSSSEIQALAKNDGLAWGSRDDYKAKNSTPEAGKVPDPDRDYEWSEVNQLVADFFKNSTPGTYDDVAKYDLTDGTKIMLTNADLEDDGIEVLPAGMEPIGQNWLGPILKRDVLSSKDISEDIENLLYGGSASDPEVEPRLSKDSNDLDSLPAGSVVKFDGSSDSKVYVKNDDGTWSASWLDDGHAQKNVSSEQIHAVAAYLGRDVQVMKEDGKPNPQAKEELPAGPLDNFKPGDFFDFKPGTRYKKNANGQWTVTDLATGIELPISESAINLILEKSNHTPKKNKNRLITDINEDGTHNAHSAPPGATVVINGKEYWRADNGLWFDSGASGGMNIPKSATEIQDAMDKTGAKINVETPEKPDYGITEENFISKLDDMRVGTSITITEDGKAATYVKNEDGTWESEEDPYGPYSSSDLTDYYYAADIVNITPGEKSAQPSTENQERPDVATQHGVTDTNFMEKLEEFPEGTSITFEMVGASPETYVKNEQGSWTSKGGIDYPNDAIENIFFPHEISDIQLPKNEPSQNESSNIFQKLLNLGDTPDVKETVDGINYDTNGNAWVPDKNGKALRVGSIVTSKSGEKGKVDYIQKGGQKVRVKTEDGNTKFWNAHLVEKADSTVPFDDTNNKYVVKVDDNGNEYLTSPDGDSIYVGDTVVSSGKTGFEGTVTGFKNGEFVLVQDPSDGKVKPRKIDKIKLVSSANAQPTPTPEPEKKPLPAGDIASLADLDSAPVGTRIRHQITKSIYQKNEDGKWSLGDKKLNSVVFGNNLHNWKVLPEDSYKYANGTDAMDTYELEASEYGQLIQTPDGVFEHTGAHTWTQVDADEIWAPTKKTKDLAQDFDSGKKITYIDEKPQVSTQTPEATSDPDPAPSVDLNSYKPEGTIKSLDEIKNAPTGSTIIMFLPSTGKPVGLFTKKENGNWSFTGSDGSVSESESQAELMGWFVNNDYLRWTEGSTPDNTPSVKEETPQPTPSGPVTDVSQLADAPVGTKVLMNYNDTGYVYEKKGDNQWQFVTGNSNGGYYEDSTFEWAIFEGSLVFEGGSPDTQPIDTKSPPADSLPGKNGKDISVGSTVSYNTPKWSKTGKVVSIDAANGDVIFVDDNTKKKAKHKAKFLSVKKDTVKKEGSESTSAPEAKNSTPDVVDTVQPPTTDPSSPWFEKPKPEKPVQDPTTTQYLPQDWVDQMLDIYSTQKGGKDMKHSNYWNHVSDLLSKGDTSYPSSVTKKDGFDSNDKFDFLLSRGWITPEMAEEGRKLFAASKAENDKKIADYEAKLDQYKQDVMAWQQANGISGEFTAAGFTLHSSWDDDAKSWPNTSSGVDDAEQYAKDELATAPSDHPTSGLKSMSAYTGSAYNGINTELRTHKGDLSKVGDSTRTHTKNLDELYDNMEEVEESFTVTRGAAIMSVSSVGGTQMSSMADLQGMVGGIITDYAYMSTSVGPKPAFESKPMWLKIRVPKGSKAMYVGYGSKKGGGKYDAYSTHPGEREVVLPRGTKMYVHKVYSEDVYGSSKVMVEVEIVPDDWTPNSGKSSSDYAGVTTQVQSQTTTSGPTTGPGVAPTPVV